MIKEIILLIIVLISTIYLVNNFCKIKKLKNLFKNYINSLTTLMKDIYSKFPTELISIQKRFDKISAEGIKLLFYLSKFLFPYFLFCVFLSNTQNFSSTYTVILLSSLPYLIIFRDTK